MGSTRTGWRAGAFRASLVAVLATSALVVPGGPASATEGYTRPAGTTITVAGHGYGHGRGMSQWGAYGAATQGLTHQQILAFYYPGTQLTAVGDPTLRVQLRSLGTADTEVVPVAGTTLTGRDSGGTQRTYTLPRTSEGTDIEAWRTIPSGVGLLSLQWRPVGSPTWTTDQALRNTPYPMTYANPAAGDVVRAVLPSGSRRDYRGTLTAVPDGAAVFTVDNVSMSDYLRSVVPSEMPASWSGAALRAQAVAARTYAARDRAGKPSGSMYDTCDTTSCQVYSGWRDLTSTGVVTATHEDSRSSAAVSDTAGTMVTYGGALAFTQFSSSNGGWSVDGGMPYLVAQPDPYDGVVAGSPHDWSSSLSVSALEAAFPSTGSFRRMEMTRDGRGDQEGRIVTFRVVGTLGSEQVSGATARQRLGLRSEWFAPTSAPAVSAPAFPRDLTDDGPGDLAVVDRASGQLRILRGDGAGGFSAPAYAGSGWSGLTMVRSAGPFGPDTRGDLLGRRADGSMWLYPGTSTGQFTQAATSLGYGWNSIDEVATPGDWDGDGHLDLLGRDAATGQLWLYVGDGAGHLLSRRVVGSGWQVMRQVLSSGDLNGDGRPDLLALDGTTNVLWLYPGDGRGGFLPRTSVTAGWGGFDALVGTGDATGDGRADVVARRASDGAMVLYAGTGTGGVRAGVVVTTGGAAWSAVVP